MADNEIDNIRQEYQRRLEAIERDHHEALGRFINEERSRLEPTRHDISSARAEVEALRTQAEAQLRMLTNEHDGQWKRVNDDLEKIRSAREDATSTLRSVEHLIQQARDTFENTRKDLDRDFKDHLEKAKNLKEQALNELAHANTQIKSKHQELEKVARSAKLAAGQEGISRFIRDFGQLVSDHTKSANRWLCATAVATFLVVASTIGLFLIWKPFGGTPDPLSPAFITGVVTRLFVLSILTTSAAWCARNYRLNRHLAVLNSHKVSALDTYASFMGMAVSDESADAVLHEATTFIFAHTQTGYLGKEEETPLSQAIDIAKSVLEKKD